MAGCQRRRHQRAEGRVVGGGGGGGGILRVEREEDDALAARRLQPLDDRGGRGVAVAHGEVDHEPVAVAFGEAGGERRGLLAGDGAQRALVGLAVPDPAVVGAGGERAPAQDHRLEQRLPVPARGVDHPAVGEELVEVAAHRPVVGGVGGAEVGEDDADPRRRHRRVVGEGRARAAPRWGVRSSRPGSCGLSRRVCRPAQSPARSPALRSTVPSASARRARAEPGRSGRGCSGAGAQPVRKITSKVAGTRPSGVPKRSA